MLFYSPVPVSICAQRQSQVTSVVELLLGMTAIRTIANMIVITVRQRMPRRASFFFKDIWTFQSPITGMVSTIELQ